MPAAFILRADPLANGVDPAASGWSNLRTATGVSADGNTIVGWGIHNGNTEAFVAVAPEPAELSLLALGALALLSHRRQLMCQTTEKRK